MVPARRFVLAWLLGAPALASAAPVDLPLGKGTVPPCTLEIPDGWTLVPGRSRGDRWLLRDARGRQVARIDYKLASTDMKMLPLVLERTLRLGAHAVEKTSVAMGPTDGTAEPVRINAATPLVTRYDVASGPLAGLFVMTETYTRSGGLEARLEAMLATLRPR
jgi:hypothetical protein